MKEITADEALILVKKMDAAVRGFKGNAEVLESAIGAYFVARNMGWKVTLLMHNTRTLKRYEEILKLDFRETTETDTEFSKKSVAFLGLKQVSNFWKAVKGEIAGAKSLQMK